jgi:hypothetical protein
MKRTACMDCPWRNVGLDSDDLSSLLDDIDLASFLPDEPDWGLDNLDLGSLWSGLEDLDACPLCGQPFDRGIEKYRSSA